MQICLSNCQQDVIVYRFTGLNYCTPGEGKPPESIDDLPEKVSTMMTASVVLLLLRITVAKFSRGYAAELPTIV